MYRYTLYDAFICKELLFGVAMIEPVLKFSAALTFKLHRSTMYADAAYCYRQVASSVWHSSEPCKNNWSDWDAMWDLYSSGPKEVCVTRGSHWRHQVNTTESSMFGGPAKMAELIHMPCGVWTCMRPRKFRSRYCWVVESGGTKEACIRWVHATCSSNAAFLSQITLTTCFKWWLIP